MANSAIKAASVIVPAFREAENLPELTRRLLRLCDTEGLVLDIIIVDDDSRDGTREWAEALDDARVRLITRRRQRSLSGAVLEGFAHARYDRLVVMDADLSHPPEKLPEMLRALDTGCDIVVGSRYVTGGSTDTAWGLLRWLNSKAATLLARPFTSIHDPMSGFFALERTTLERAAPLNPVGYKIALELIVKCGCRNVCEVPIHFARRVHGKSKLTAAEQLKYLQHLAQLAAYKLNPGARKS